MIKILLAIVFIGLLLFIIMCCLLISKIEIEEDTKENKEEEKENYE